MQLGFEVKLTDKAIKEGRKPVSVSLETEAAGAKTKKLIDNKVIGVNGSGEFKFEVDTDKKITFSRTDGKAINVDLSHALSKKGTATAPSTVESFKVYGKDGAEIADATKRTSEDPTLTALTVVDHESSQRLINLLDQKRACQVFCVSGVWFVSLFRIFQGSVGIVLVVLSASYSRLVLR